ncbi:MAG: hypothetical protein IPN38_17850 [Flavobacteriales bacterium]|nr:hypothetical protein [Flavobacteriales bacterium]
MKMPITHQDDLAEGTDQVALQAALIEQALPDLVEEFHGLGESMPTDRNRWSLAMELFLPGSWPDGLVKHRQHLARVRFQCRTALAMQFGDAFTHPEQRAQTVALFAGQDFIGVDFMTVVLLKPITFSMMLWPNC